MKILILFSSITLLTTNGEFVSATEFNELNVQKWNDYKTQFSKQYETAALEEQKMTVFITNENKITQHNEKYNNGEVKFKMAVNQFSDMTAEEFQQTHTSQHLTSKDHPACAKRFTSTNYASRLIKVLPANLGKAPKEKNWVEEGAVTSVKYQGSKCGTCWDFAAVAAIESQYFLHGHEKKLVSLSPQQILDCIGKEKYGSNDCKGGCVSSALQYVIDNGGIEADESYMYAAKKADTCKYKPERKVVTIKDFKTPVAGDENLLKEIVGLIGPCTCSFQVVDDFQFYSSGIYTSAACKKTPEWITHELLIVGYGSEDGMDYWLCKNQWSNEWGEEGYARIRRNTNECSIALASYYPII